MGELTEERVREMIDEAVDRALTMSDRMRMAALKNEGCAAERNSQAAVAESDGGNQFHLALEDMLDRLDDTGILPDREPRCYGYLVHYLGGALHRRRGASSIASIISSASEGHRKAAELGFRDEGALMEGRAREPGLDQG